MRFYVLSHSPHSPHSWEKTLILQGFVRAVPPHSYHIHEKKPPDGGLLFLVQFYNQYGIGPSQCLVILYKWDNVLEMLLQLLVGHFVDVFFYANPSFRISIHSRI